MKVGLPDLPAGQRWVVAPLEHAYWYTLVRLEVLTKNPKRRRWYQRRYEPNVWVEVGVSRARSQITPSELPKMAREAFADRQKRLDKKANEEYARSIRGTYPPKDVKDTRCKT